MPIKMTTPMDAVRRAAQDGVDSLVAGIVRQLAYAGEMAVNEARSLPNPPVSVFMDENGEYRRDIDPHQPDYIDWTANLRSSVGYVVFVDGKPVTVGDFAPVAGKEGSGQEGSEDGRAFALSLAPEFPSGITLVVVAGMRYAKYVSAKGYDVIDSGAALARKVVPELIRELFAA